MPSLIQLPVRTTVPETRQIRLTQGQLATVDAADFDDLNKYKWCAWWNPCTRSYYAVRYATYTDASGKTKKTSVYMHRQILELHRGDHRQGDHINHETLDNRRGNLRIATRSEQQHNTRRRQDNRSGYKGVVWNRGSKSWTSRLTIDGKQTQIGSFSTAEAAAQAYDAEARRVYGEFALLNHPVPAELPAAA